MPYFTQVHILDLCAYCDTMSILVVFRDGKRRESDHVWHILEAPGPRRWNLFRTVVASMSGSGERKPPGFFVVILVNENFDFLCGVLTNREIAYAL